MAEAAPRQGRLLVATPELGDPNFERTVVLLIEHGPSGAAGVVLNRPSDVRVAAALPHWEVLAAVPELVFLGGPVRPDALVGLARPGGTGDGVAGVVLPGVGVVDLESDPLVLAGEIDVVRLFVGYAGWTTGQLEAEIAGGSWFVVDAEADDVFSAHPEALWRGVLVRQGGVFRTVTEDPTRN